MKSWTSVAPFAGLFLVAAGPLAGCGGDDVSAGAPDAAPAAEGGPGHPPTDAGASDATASDAAGNDATPPPPPPIDAGEDGGSSDASDASDASTACADLVDKMTKAPIVLPDRWASLDLASGSNPKGLTVDEANTAGCAVFDADTTPPTFPGYRLAHWGTAPNDVRVWFNFESRVIEELEYGTGYAGSVAAASRAGGAFGAHTYLFAKGGVKRDGADFTIDWSVAGRPTQNELYDALMSTYAPATPAVTSCQTAGTCLVVDDPANGSFFGARPLHFFFGVVGETSQIDLLYTTRPSARPDCSTPIANRERMLYGDIYSYSIGGLDLFKQGASKQGMTVDEADAIECSGVAATAPDPGYSAMAWGSSGEVLLEYNTASKVAYKAYARAGYKGRLDAVGLDGTTKFSVTIGAITKNGTPFAIDWATPTASVTELSNAVNAAMAVIDTNDTDCAAQGDCTIVADDGKGNSVVDLPNAGLTFLFPKNTSAPSTIFTTWDNGK